MESKHGVRPKSLVVPSVIELAKDPSATVPDRYLHHDLDPPFVSLAGTGHQDQSLPVISLASLLGDDLAEFDKLHNACSNWGFFQVVNHGVSDQVIERFKVESKDFFELPMAEKKKYWQTPDEIEGFGEKFVISEDQKLSWLDAFSLTIRPLEHRRPHLMPLLPLPFRETLEKYTNELKQLANKIFDCMAKDLKTEREEFRGLFEEGIQTCTILYYPPCSQYDKVIGSMPHSDASAITILLQLNQVKGLQIKKDGRWLPIMPLPNAFIVNIGDIMEVVSNGMYRSVEHRVMVNPEMERLSVASFFSARLDAEVGPAPNLVTLESPARFRRIITSEYLNGFYTQPLKGKSHLETLRIE